MQPPVRPCAWPRDQSGYMAWHGTLVLSIDAVDIHSLAIEGSIARDAWFRQDFSIEL